ncbi:MAG: hypothetical protein ACXABY_29590 [Candidatus Thorarchaeota archaeon]
MTKMELIGLVETPVPELGPSMTANKMLCQCPQCKRVKLVQSSFTVKEGEDAESQRWASEEKIRASLVCPHCKD